MAKRKAAATATAKTPEPAKKERATVEPQQVHELLRLPGPYDPPPQPAGWPDRVTVWDPGISILEMRRKFSHLFYSMDWYEGVAFAKQTDSWKWRQFKTTPLLPGKPYLAQLEKVQKGDEVQFTREVVLWHLIHCLTTGEGLDLGRLRCRDVLTTGCRVMVSFGAQDFDLGSVSDEWESPFIGLASVFVPKPPARKK